MARALLLGLALCALAVVPMPAAAEDGTWVRLSITLASHAAPALRECIVEIATPASLLEVLDEATGPCIASWEYSGGDGPACIDGICGAWRTYVNETRKLSPLWQVRVQATGNAEFVFAERVTL